MEPSRERASQRPLLRFADRFVPNVLRKDIEVWRRARIAVISSFAIAGMFLASLIGRDLIGEQPAEVRTAAMIGVVATLSAPFLLRATERLWFAGSITPFVIVSLLAISAHYEGTGLSSPMMFAAPLVPGLAIAFLGLAGLYWFALLIAGQALLVLALPYVGAPRPAPHYDAQHLEIAQLGAILLTTSLLVFITSVMERQRRSMEVRLEQSEARHRGLLEAVPDLMLRVDRRGAAIDVHPGDGRHTLPVPGEASRVRALADLLPADLAAQCADDIERTLHSGQLTVREFATDLEDGPRVFEMRQMPSGDAEVTVILRDITAKKQKERELERRARHDSLTGLENRRQFRDALEQALQQATLLPEVLAVLFIDLDRFKQVNDVLGHAMGDAVLAQVGERLRHVKRDSDVAARHGGDEFTVLLRRLKSPHTAEEVASRILEALMQPIQHGGHTVEVGGSIGIALYPQDARDADGLMRCADTAMYTAKSSGGDTVQRYRQDLEVPKSEERRLQDS